MLQLGEKHTSYGVAAQLMQGGAPDMATATTIIRGQKHIDAGNKTALGDKSASDVAFDSVVGAALNFNAKSREAIKKAAEAHYVQTAGIGDGKFTEKTFKASVNAVMGGAERIGRVNSVKTVLPKGVDEDTFNKAVDNFTPPDLLATSVDGRGQPNGMAPMQADGEAATAMSVSAEGRLIYVGSDVYEVYMKDNKRLITQQRDDISGAPMPYRMKLDKPTVVGIAARDKRSLYSGLGGVSP
jgi:hypothetical protein